MREKRSPIWKIPKSELKKLVEGLDTFSAILKYFGLVNKGGNYKTLKARLKHDNIDYSHIPQGRGAGKGIARGGVEPIPLERILIKGSTYNRYNLKKRLVREGLLKYICEGCGQIPEWKGKPLGLVLDHINGDSTDNRLENLRFLCPNCNSQTPTFAGRKPKTIYNCLTCGQVTKGHSKGSLCQSCASRKKRKVKNRPSKEVLLKQIRELGYCGTGRLYGVSDNTIRKWL